MKKLAGCLLFVSVGLFGQTKISDMPAATTLSGTELIPIVQAGVNKKATPALWSGLFVPITRTITINGTTYDLSANRSWTVGSPYTFTNGLTETAGNVKLGGGLIENTTINGAGFDFNLGTNASRLNNFTSYMGPSGSLGFFYKGATTAQDYSMEMASSYWRVLNSVSSLQLNNTGIILGVNNFPLEMTNGYNGGFSNNYFRLDGSRAKLYSNDATFRFTVGGNGTTDNPAALLDMQSTTKGFAQPRMTGAERDAIASPFAGLSVFNTTRSEQSIYTGTAYRGTAYAPEVNTQAGTTYTIVAADNGKMIFITSATPVTVTLPNGLMDNFSCSIIRKGAGIVTLSATGTLEATASTIEVVNTGAYVFHSTGNVWTATGSLGAPIVADVSGPASAVNNRVVFFDGTSGKLIKDSGLTLAGNNTGDQTITLTSDVTGSGTGSFATTIASNAVTNAKLADVPTQTFKGRTTAATGDPEDLTIAQAKTLLNLTGTNSGDQTSIVGITGTLAQFNTAVTDADLARTDAANTFTGIQTFSTPIATGSVATMTATVGGGVPTPPNNTTTFLRGDGTFAAPAGGGSGTVTNTGGALTANSVVLGAGTVDTKVVAGITTDGTAQLNLGVNATTLGKVKMFGNTSGDATIQPAAVAGTATVQTLPATTGTLVNRVATANGVSASNTDGALTVTLGAITPTSVNSVVMSGSATPTLAVTGTSSISGTHSGTASGTNTGDQPSIVGITGTLAQFNTAVTDADLARTDAANTFTGIQTFSTPIATGSVATMTATVGGGVPTPPNNTTTFLRGDGTFAATGGTSQWTTTGSDIYYNTGKVGIGLIAPATPLDVQGTVTEGVLGAELITAVADRDFSAAGNWTGTNWTVGSGVNTHTVGANALTLPNSALTSAPVSGNIYQIGFTINTTVAGTLTLSFGGTNGVVVGQQTNTETQTMVVEAVSAGVLTFTPNAVWTGTLDNITVKLVTPANVAQSIRHANGTVGLEIRSGGSSLSNTFFGLKSGKSSTTGMNNTAIGVSALFSNTVGVQNVALGSSALAYNSNGSSNTAIGHITLIANTTGSNNMGLGYNALGNNTSGSNNTAMGYTTLGSNTVGNNNTSVGWNSLMFNTTGNNNVALGSGAGDNIVAGSRNVIIGDNIDAPIADGSNQLNIGNAIFGTGITGTGTTIAGNIGIGTASPGARLTVAVDDAATNTVVRIERLTKTSSGTPAIGIGTGIEMEVETSAANNEIGATIEAITTDVTAASEDFDVVVKNMTNGAAATEKLRVTSTGEVQTNVGTSPGVVQTMQWLRLTSNFVMTNGTGEQKLFNNPTNGALTLEVGTYFFECSYYITGMSATSGNASFDILGAGTATVPNAFYSSNGIDGTATSAATITGVFSTAAQSPAAIVSAGVGTTLGVTITGQFSVSVAGTIIPSITLLTASAISNNIGAYFKVNKVNTSSTATSFGNWN